MTMEYKSPKHKLVKFFEQSRDSWKAKTKKAKADIKNLEHKLRYHKNNNAALKCEIKILKQEINKLTKELSKKNESNIQRFNEPVARHKYSLEHIKLSISLVLSSVGLRCSARATGIFCNELGLPVNSQSWYSSRLWLLKLGLFKLTRAKEQADDWLWIMDHSVQWGSEKCLLILGIRKKNLPRDRALRYSDVEPIELLPVTKSNGDIVYQQLQNTVKKTGIPRAIISDKGSDIKSGIDKFIELHNHTIHVYDITHCVAACLKSTLENDLDWQSFIEFASMAQRYMRQTSVAALAPPNQRSKARYMNISQLVTWATKIIALLKNGEVASYDENEINRKLGWIHYYSDDIERWGRIDKIATKITSHINRYGISRGTTGRLISDLSSQQLCEHSLGFQENILRRILKTECKVHVGEHMLGSSDIIESLFGKFKNLEQAQSSSGFTNLLLALPAMVGDQCANIIKTAMEKTKAKEVWGWLKSNIGLSVQAKRKLAFSSTN